MLCVGVLDERGDLINKAVKMGDGHPIVDDIHLIIHLPALLDQTTELPLFDCALPHDRASTSAQSCWVLESTQTPSWSWLLLSLKHHYISILKTTTDKYTTNLKGRFPLHCCYMLAHQYEGICAKSVTQCDQQSTVVTSGRDCCT